jgi:hypothetical protein
MRIFLATILIAGAMQAQSRDTPPALDSRIYEVATGGYWKTGSRAGTFRVVVIAEGFEEIRYRAFLQWLSEPTQTETARLVTTKSISDLADRCFSVLSPTIALEGGKWRLTMKGANVPLKQPNQVLRFELGEPGIVRASANCAPAG